MVDYNHGLNNRRLGLADLETLSNGESLISFISFCVEDIAESRRLRHNPHILFRTACAVGGDGEGKK